MKTYSTEQPNVYDISGKELRIHWDIIETTNADGDIQWEASEALCSAHASRSQIIEAIIGSAYSTAEEIATINNKDADLVAYQAYQDFRALAKSLADGYLATKA